MPKDQRPDESPVVVFLLAGIPAVLLQNVVEIVEASTIVFYPSNYAVTSSFIPEYLRLWLP